MKDYNFGVWRQFQDVIYAVCLLKGSPDIYILRAPLGQSLVVLEGCGLNIVWGNKRKTDTVPVYSVSELNS